MALRNRGLLSPGCSQLPFQHPVAANFRFKLWPILAESQRTSGRNSCMHDNTGRERERTTSNDGIMQKTRTVQRNATFYVARRGHATSRARYTCSARGHKLRGRYYTDNQPATLGLYFPPFYQDKNSHLLFLLQGHHFSRFSATMRLATIASPFPRHAPAATHEVATLVRVVPRVLGGRRR